MSTPASSRVDMVMGSAMDRVYDTLYRYFQDGYCLATDITEALRDGWGDGVAEGWLEWLNEGEE